MMALIRLCAACLLIALTVPVSAALLSMPEAPADTSEASSAPGTIQLERDADQDERIASRLSDIFANVPSLANVTVSVSQGVVSLGGTAPDRGAADRAEVIASGVVGVVTVENAIERDVSVDVGEQVGGLQTRVEGLVRALPLVASAFLVAGIIVAFGYLLARFSSFWRRITPNAFLAELIASAIRFIFAILAIVVALDMIGAGALMGAVLGGAGLIGIALGFAMRDTIENYVASVMLSLRQPFRANDLVVIGDHQGRVVRLTSRATVLMTLDGNHLRIPNSTVFKAVILNYTRNPQRRFDFVLGIDADDDPEAARVLGRETLRTMPFLLDDPAPEVRIEDVGDSTVILRFLGWIDQREADWYKVRGRAIALVKAALEDGGFGLPEPIYRLRFDSRTMPLPFANVSDTAAASPSAPMRQKPAMSTVSREDLGPQNEVARMVDEERAETTHENDLLDAARPVE